MVWRLCERRATILYTQAKPLNSSEAGRGKRTTGMDGNGRHNTRNSISTTNNSTDWTDMTDVFIFVKL